MATEITTKGILTINGKQVEETFNNLKRASGQLERELRKLTPGTQEFIDKSAQLKEVNKRFDEVRSQINETKKASKELNTETKTLDGTFGNLKSRLTDTFTSVLAGEVTFKSLGSTIKVFAAQSWAAISSIPVIGWVTAAAGAIGLAVNQIMQYNTELEEANKITASVTKLQGDALDEITLKSRAMESAFGFDRKEMLEAAKALVNEYKITYVEALDAIEKGAVKGGKSNEEYLKSIREYPSFFAKAGFAVQDFIGIVNAGYDLGIYDDKLPDAIKEFTLSITEQTKTSRDALVNAFGAPFADDLLKRVSTGKTTVKNALTEVAAESDKYNLTQKQQAQLTADLFRGAGEDAGGFLAIMQAVNQAAEDLNRPLTETEQILQDQVDKYNELETAKYEAMESDSVLALKREFDNLWKNLQIGYYNFLAWIRKADREFNASAVYMRGVFLSLPNAASAAFGGIIAALGEMIKGFGSGASSIAKFFKGDFDGAKAEAEKFLNTLPNFHQKIKSITSNFVSSLNTGGTTLANQYRKEYDAATKAKAEMERKLAASKNKPGNNNDGSEGKAAADKKAGDKAAKDAEAARKKAEAERKKDAEARLKDLEESLKAEADANNRNLEAEIQFRIDKLKIQEDSLQKELGLADLERSKELNAQRKQQDEILKNIEDLQLKIANAKSPEAKANYEKALADQRALLQTHDQIVLLGEETHQFKIRATRQKWSAKDFEDFVKAEQRKIDEARRLDEETINGISTMEEAKLALSQMQHLKLTDQELRGIRNLEDAKRALREDADRKMLAASLVSLEKQKAQLEEALKGMTSEAAEKLKADLDVLTAKITGLKGAINGGTEADAKKVQEEGDAAKGAVDVLGFSVLDWENCFKNLDTTEGKLRAVGMAFQALSNAGQMFADLTRSLAEKDMRRFEAIQNKKKADLLNQLNTGYITNEQYNKEIQRMEAETANKKAEMEYKQAKADKVARMFAIVGNTAMGIASALAAPFPINTWLPWIVGAMGAVQLGIVAAQPLPERPSFADGGYTGDGFGSPDKSGFKPAGIVHEGEWTAPKWMVESPRTAKVIDYLESVRLGKTTPMAEGGFTQPETSTSTTAPAPLSENNTNSELMPVLYRLGNFLEYLISKGVYIEKNPKNGKEAKEMIEMWDELKNKNKH